MVTFADEISAFRTDFIGKRGNTTVLSDDGNFNQSILIDKSLNIKSSTGSAANAFDANKLNLRLKELFKERVAQFREAVYLLTGYKVHYFTNMDMIIIFRWI